MHYFYYLKLKNYLQYIALIHYKLSLVFKIYPTDRRRVDAGQDTRGTPTVNHDSGVGANEKNHGTTAAQHT
jgi:hypothetical protein